MKIEGWMSYWKKAGCKGNEHLNICSVISNRKNHSQYHLNLKKVFYSEVAGMIICLSGIAAIAYTINKSDSDLVKFVAISSILLLILLPLISIMGVWRLRGFGKKKSTAKLRFFDKREIRFNKRIWLSFILCHLFLAVVFILISRFFGVNISENIFFGIILFAAGYTFLVFNMV
jgi:hypothetical protein